MLTSIGLLVVIIGGVLFGVFISRKETEYEYIMVNEDVDIARIIAKKSRKKMCSFSNNDVKFIAKSDSIYLDNELQQDSSIKQRITPQRILNMLMVFMCLYLTRMARLNLLSLNFQTRP